METNKIIAIIIVVYMFILILLQGICIAKYYSPFILKYLLPDNKDKKPFWNFKYDRFLLFCTFSMLGFNFYIIFLFFKNNLSDWLIVFYLIVFTILFFVSIKLPKWVKKSYERDEEILKNKEIEKSEKKENNNKISSEIKVFLYREFKKYSFINDSFEEEHFIADFLENPIELNIEVPVLREFYNMYVERFGKIRLKEFVELFVNNNTGKKYDYKQMTKNSNPESKKTDELKLIFLAIDKIHEKSNIRKGGFNLF